MWLQVLYMESIYTTKYAFQFYYGPIFTLLAPESKYAQIKTTKYKI